jgi:CRP-like cAMP-binding protein
MKENDLLIQTIRQRVALSNEEAQLLCPFFRQRSLSKKELLFSEGAVAHDVAFVLEGVLKVWALDAEGHERTLQFAPTDWWITDLASFIKQAPSHWQVEALEKTEVLLLSREEQLRLFEVIPQMQTYFRLITENALVAYQQRLQEAMGASAIERYKSFCLKYPTLVDRISQKDIASYIGVSPEFLSKMKSEILRAGKSLR